MKNKYQIGDCVRYRQGGEERRGIVFKIVVAVTRQSLPQRKKTGLFSKIVEGAPISYGIVSAGERILEKDIIGLYEDNSLLEQSAEGNAGVLPTQEA
jgi:hypothetical protein